MAQMGSSVINLFIIIFGGAIGLALLWAVYNMSRFKWEVKVHEQVGDDFQTWTTKAGKFYDTDKERYEMRIRKSWLTPWKYWSKPIPGNEVFWKSEKGKKYLQMTKVGDHAADFHYCKPNSLKYQKIKPVDSQALDWHIEGQRSDADKYRRNPSKFEKYAPYAMFTLIAMVLIFGFIYVPNVYEDLGSTVEQIQEERTEQERLQAEQARANAGIQQPLPERNDPGDEEDSTGQPGNPIDQVIQQENGGNS
jgi:hypothetical protein